MFFWGRRGAKIVVIFLTTAHRRNFEFLSLSLPPSIGGFLLPPGEMLLFSKMIFSLELKLIYYLHVNERRLTLSVELGGTDSSGALIGLSLLGAWLPHLLSRN